MEYVIRFILGGLICSAFAVIGDVIRPRTFSGLFGAAPTIALATLGLAFATQPAQKIATEGRSMLLGAAGLLTYALVTRYLLRRFNLSALLSAALAYAGWFAAAFLLWFIFLR